MCNVTQMQTALAGAEAARQRALADVEGSWEVWGSSTKDDTLSWLNKAAAAWLESLRSGWKWRAATQGGDASYGCAEWWADLKWVWTDMQATSKAVGDWSWSGAVNYTVKESVADVKSALPSENRFTLYLALVAVAFVALVILRFSV